MCHGLRCSESTTERMSKGETGERKVSLGTEHNPVTSLSDGVIRKQLNKDLTLSFGVFKNTTEGFGNDIRL